MRLDMNKMLSPKFVLLISFLFVASISAFAQDNAPPDASRPPFGQGQGPQVKRPNLLRILGLTPEQMQQVRKMNQERKPFLDAAMVRVRNANRALDEAIYADNFDEATFQASLKELQLAQAEAARLRFLNELGIRKILTPEQLARFRDLRRKFAPPPEGQGPPPDDKGILQGSPKRPSQDQP
jgi:Spy/CpxP family protein refolding chaperone